MLIAPSLVEVDVLVRELSRGIEESVVVLTGALTPKKLRAAWEQVVTATTPLLVIGTPPALSAPVPHLDVIIVERESARSYTTRHTPPISLRLAAEYVAKEAGARLVLADYPVRVETRARLDAHMGEELIRAQVRPAGIAEVHVIDTRAHDAKLKERRAFTPLSSKGRDEIRAVLSRKGRVAIFSTRKGIAPLTVCNDCGTPVTDPTTGTPMTLIKTPAGNMFVSRQTGALVPSHTVCRTCGSWNLVTLGIGVDRVVEYVKREFPKSTVLTFTKDTTPTHKTALKLAQTFYDTEGALMVGTERMLPYLTQPIEQVVVASIDTALSLPAWRAGEYSLQTLCALRTKALESLIIETRKPDNPVIRAVATGNIADYYRDELELRSLYGYPPFSLFISLFWTGTETQCAEKAALITKTLAHRDLVGPLPPEIVERSRLEQRATLRIDPHTWPSESLSQELDSLPRDIRVVVDPEDIV
jgi:primosomal protein N' (replication factor Y)